MLCMYKRLPFSYFIIWTLLLHSFSQGQETNQHTSQSDRHLLTQENGNSWGHIIKGQDVTCSASIIFSWIWQTKCCTTRGTYAWWWKTQYKSVSASLLEARFCQKFWWFKSCAGLKNTMSSSILCSQKAVTSKTHWSNIQYGVQMIHCWLYQAGTPDCSHHLCQVQVDCSRHTTCLDNILGAPLWRGEGVLGNKGELWDWGSDGELFRGRVRVGWEQGWPICG